MIAYFDTSAIIPLLIEEPGTARCEEHWSVADRVVSIRLAEVEARAALAQAARLDRLTSRQHRDAVSSLGELLSQLDLIEVREELVKHAGDLAESHALRACDALHLAAAIDVNDDELVVVAGDRALLDAASARGLLIAPTA